MNERNAKRGIAAYFSNREVATVNNIEDGPHRSKSHRPHPPCPRQVEQRPGPLIAGAAVEEGWDEVDGELHGRTHVLRRRRPLGYSLHPHAAGSPRKS